MSFYYVTGIAGSGKSTVCKELLDRGYEAHEADGNLSGFYHNETNQKVDRPTLASERTKQWREQHTWLMSKELLSELKEKSNDEPVFVCGVASNEESLLYMFDKIFALDLDLNLMRERIMNRGKDSFGQSDHEMQTLIEWHKTCEEYYERIGAIVIDATYPINQVVDEILTNINTK